LNHNLRHRLSVFQTGVLQTGVRLARKLVGVSEALRELFLLELGFRGCNRASAKDSAGFLAFSLLEPR
jgi:hypothetical protein